MSSNLTFSANLDIHGKGYMKTSQVWWNETKNNPAAFAMWLQKQEFGERLAAKRVLELAERLNSAPIRKIAHEEAKHANWVLSLLKARNIPAITEHPDRYWAEATFSNDQEAVAVAAHAEKMRLERISVISADLTAPFDVVKVFRKILSDEVRHEEVFRTLSTSENYEAARGNHERGAAALGLTT